MGVGFSWLAPRDVKALAAGMVMGTWFRIRGMNQGEGCRERNVGCKMKGVVLKRVHGLRSRILGRTCLRGWVGCRV